MAKHLSKFVSIFLLMIVISGINAQNIRQTLIKSNADYAIVRVDFMNYHTNQVLVNGELMQTLVMENAYPLLKKGDPELLKSTFSLIVPENSNPEIQVLDAQFSEIQNFKLAPSKGMIFRNVNPEDVPYAKNDSYNSAEYLLGAPAAIGQDYQLRDYHGVVVQTYPFDYNPANEQLKVYSSVTLKITYNGTGVVKAAQKSNKTFDDVYSRQFLNYRSDYRSNPVTENGDMLIISPDEFMESLQPYIEWKKKTGYNVEMVSVADAGGNSTAIKSYVTEYYNEHNLVFLLIVGDNNFFPAPTQSGEYSDNLLTQIVGNDYYPDIILGKISAENVEQIETQVQRFLEYEQNPSNTDHLPVFCGIGSQEGGSYSDNGEIDWQHIRLIDNKLLGYTYTSGYELFEGSQGGLDAAGSPSATDVANAVNAGVGIITYCGHGNYNLWGTTSFSNNHVNALTNKGKLPFIISVACLNGDYANKTCFAESWVRATKDGTPTGAVGFLGSTINQPWNPPMRAQDEMINMLVDTTGTIKKITFGGMFFNGMIKMLDTYNSDATATFRTWILFGDPTLLMRTAVPSQLNVEHLPVLPVGVTDITFSSPVENAKVTVSKNGEIIAVGNIENGSFEANLEEAYTPADTLDVVATALNHIPYVGIIQFIPNDGPYLLCNDIQISDNGNNDNQADYGETINVTPTFKNVGSAAANNSHITFTTDDSHVTMLNSTLTINSLAPDASTTQNNAFSFKVSNAVPNNHNAQFTMLIVTGSDSIVSSKNITLRAPKLAVSNMVIDDTESGNSNGHVDFEETATLTFTLRNVGSSKSVPGTVTITNPAGELAVQTSTSSVNALDPNGTQNITCQVVADESVQSTAITFMRVIYTAGNYSVTEYFPVKIGAVREDWETGDLTAMEWENPSQKPWYVTTQNPYEGDYCLRSGQISNGSSTILRITTDCSVTDTISFYYKVSSEENYDMLSFLIDGQKIGEWSGVSGWARAAFPVDSGSHTFAWRYSKDYYASYGSDCAWIDNIEFPSGSIKSPVSIETRTEADIQVMPNPTQDFVYVNTDNDVNNATYRVFDINGRLIIGGKLNGNRTKISLINCTKGVYILNILEGSDVIKTEKIVKQ